MSTSATTKPRLVTPQFVLLGSASLAYFLADGMLVPAVPRYVASELTGGNIAVGVAVAVFSLSALALRPWTGRFADRHGRSIAMVGGGIVFAASVAGYGLADSVGVLSALRLLTGVGDAFFFVGAVTAMSDLAPVERRGEAISLFSLSLYVGLAVGPLAGEAIVNTAGFTTVWLVSAGSALLAVLLSLRVGDTREPVVATPTAGRSGLIPRAAVVPALLLLALIWGMAGFLAFVPLYALDLGLSGAGFLLFGFAAIVVVIRSAGARIPDHLGAHRSVRLALLCTTIALITIGTWRTVPGLILGTALLGLGVALGTPAIMTLALNRAPATERGATMATVTMSIDTAQALGPITLGLAAATTTRPTAFLTAALISGAGLALAMRSHERA
ncbi:MFS transporter [Kribbella turkmenica]|uniref:MFS transporter n=1 Tax=Kribbella turkmenica TaxID=2530375 RepID=A0A4R4X8E0_9ACTN|nr:MFS transporter [Kribbella turkmenica]TDD26692.1 MFS transporter [Kribbella turkmenica]